MKLTERRLVKELTNTSLADTRYDTAIDRLIRQASTAVARFTGRIFEYGQRTEYHRSYDQWWDDPDPQYIVTEAAPIDEGQPITIIWAAEDRHDTNGVTLDPTENDFSVWDAEKGVISIRKWSGLASNLILPVRQRLPIFTYDQRGFKITYTGGYQLSTDPGGDNATGAITFAVNPSDLDTITLNGTTWTLVSGAPTGNQTQIQASTAATLFQLAADLNASTDDEVRKCTYSVTAADTLSITYDEKGTAGNAFTLAASAATPSGGTLTGGAGADPDPLDDYGVIQVPEDLKIIVAQKVADTWNLRGGDKGAGAGSSRPAGLLKPWTLEEQAMLEPFRRPVPFSSG